MDGLNIAILGKGRSGQAAKRLAEAIGASSVMLLDDSDSPCIEMFAGTSLIIVSPGMPPASPSYQTARRSGVEMISELEFAARNFKGKYLAVTGTNGKTTTTELTVHLLNAIGINSTAAGNIGHAFCEVSTDVLNGTLLENTLPVVEVSSYQLELIRDFSPWAAALTNIAEDHLDRYPGGISEYTATKLKIFDKVEVGNRILGRSFAIDEIGVKMPDVATPSFNMDSGYLLYGDKRLLQTRELKLQGRHNQENILVALELVSRAISEEKLFSKELKDALISFDTGENRVELVLEKDGVRYVNDSKGTNPAAVEAALDMCSEFGKVRLILGGLDKEMDFSPLKKYVSEISKAYIIGQCREKIFEQLNEVVPCQLCDGFEECVNEACDDALSGETVLLSPGCASFDMFKSYAVRGETFCNLIRERFGQK
ncbi:MAG: UDP-N-acetylmuramoyl-L-alanine--D-glutamate ligase [Lentisphaerae bacterium]|nr:UDP-N-acetylmuramoyl-L-alanine--D-glutamate ligase [Lentisphaerota bacterium]MCP4103552.1 UDP-N-acetylmuramoyl-L-alanine--D-glutamate ligase [Lentisphaerota bacterium]